jgi:hypothetical protein
MPQLTGFFKGTDQADIFSGTIELTSPPADVSGAAIVNAAIAALGGNDQIKGIATVTSDPSLGGQAEAYLRSCTTLISPPANQLRANSRNLLKQTASLVDQDL